ncbi:site-2 protease family protein, partial [Chloroflexota bacterium]
EVDLEGADGVQKVVRVAPRWKPPEGEGATGIVFGFIVTVMEIAPGSPAEEAGIVPGDTVLSVGGQPALNAYDLWDIIEQNLDREVELSLLGEDGVEKTATLVPLSDPTEEESASGITVVSQSMPNEHETSRSYPFWKAVPEGFSTCIDTFILFRNEIKGWIVGRSSPQVTGPVGIFELTGEMAEAGISPLLNFTAFLSINLGIINLFPLPALDGGRIVFVALEWARRGKRVSPEKERMVHAIGFALLITLMVLVAYLDVIRIISGEGIF